VAQDSLKLLDGVREVASLVSSDEQEAVTQRAFDAERESSPAHAHLPPARRITERLGLSWAEVLAIAHAPKGEQSNLLATKDREPSSVDWLNEQHIVAVLQIVAQRLRRKTLTMTAYSAEREKLLAEDRARWSQGRLPLPTTHQITRVTGSWGAALLRAGLGGKRKSRTARKTLAPVAPDYASWDYDSCVAAVARYVAQLPESERSRSTPAGYNAWAATQEHAPETHIVRHHCKTWAAARRAAMSRPS